MFEIGGSSSGSPTTGGYLQHQSPTPSSTPGSDMSAHQNTNSPSSWDIKPPQQLHHQHNQQHQHQHQQHQQHQQLPQQPMLHPSHGTHPMHPSSHPNYLPYSWYPTDNPGLLT